MKDLPLAVADPDIPQSAPVETMGQPLSVLVVTNTYPTPEHPSTTPCVRDQLEVLKSKGVRIELLHINYRHKLEYPRAAWRLFLLNFQRRRYHLIHAHYGYCGLLAGLQWRYPVVVTFHGSDLIDPREGLLGRLVSRLVRAVIVMSPEMKVASGRRDAHVIPFGIDHERFHPYPKALARQELGMPEHGRLVLFPWNPARPEKRFALAQAAVERLQRDYPDLVLLPVWDRPREVIARAMQACDALILTSTEEGSPVAVRESLACGLPVVSVDVGDVRELIEGVPGCAICAPDPEVLADRLAVALRRPAPEETGARSGGYGTEAAAERVLRVYQAVMGRS